MSPRSNLSEAWPQILTCALEGMFKIPLCEFESILLPIGQLVNRVVLRDQLLSLRSDLVRQCAANERVIKPLLQFEPRRA